MMFWIIAAALTAAVTYAVTKPLLRPAEEARGESAADVAVYKDQLREIDADAARGSISPVEADAARAEVARRMLRTADAPQAPAAIAREIGRFAYVAASVALPIATLALYLNFGSPGMPAQPLAERLAAGPNHDNANDLVAKVEAALRANPDDGKGWDVIAPVYMAQARYADAASAYATAMRLLGESAARLQGFADARIRADNGVIAEDAKKALERVRALAPERQEARVWLALAKEQDGDVKAAIADYRAVLAESAADAPWRKMLEERIAALENPAPAQSEAKGPGAADVAAFEAMTPEQRQTKINSMVDGLAAKLKAQPKDRDGWQRLIRAYTALGRRDDAMKAAQEARAGLAGDAAEMQQFEAWMKQVGLSG